MAVRILKRSLGTNKTVAIIGGGTAGIGVASQLRKVFKDKIILIEPSTFHYYQPLWTLVGSGLRDAKDSVKPMKEMIPNGVEWVHDAVKGIDPTSNKVLLNSGSSLSYDYLVIAAGLKEDWGKVSGLSDAISDPESKVVSVYGYDKSSTTWKTLSSLQGGKVLFTMPAAPIKCAGAAQKIMWLFEELVREKKLRTQFDISYWSSGGAMFGVKKYSDILEEVRKARAVDVFYFQDLVAVDAQKKIATFRSSKEEKAFTEVAFDAIHVTPPMSPPPFLKNGPSADKPSPLVDENGWVAVDRHTLQSTSHRNVFALGDCCNAPNTKTAAAVMSQAPVVVHNLMQSMAGHQAPLDGYYNGYGCCPLLVGKNRVVLAEFGFEGAILETFDRKKGKFPYSLLGQEGLLQEMFFAWMKKRLFSFVYWNLYPKGLWFGTNVIWKPDVRKK